MTLKHRTDTVLAINSSYPLWYIASDQPLRIIELINKFAETNKQEWQNHVVHVLVTSTGKVEHLTKSDSGEDPDSVLRLWLDWFLLSESHTCAFVRSSFPRTACYASFHRQLAKGLVQQMVTNQDLGRYQRIKLNCANWMLK